MSPGPETLERAVVRPVRPRIEGQTRPKGDRVRVEYALRDLRKPIGVTRWETGLVENLPENLQSSLPTVEELEAELEGRNGRSPAPAS